MPVQKSFETKRWELLLRALRDVSNSVPQNLFYGHLENEAPSGFGRYLLVVVLETPCDCFSPVVA